jgi:acetyltransferase-like isoleucine patch superfamily enzyme
VTLGAAAGATIGDRAVWMAGVYIGVHSGDFDR